MEEISKTWNIADPNARKVIQNDENRSEDAKKEDIEFFDDNFGPNAERKMEMAGRDEDYDRELLSSLLSKEAKENGRQEREKQKAAARDKEKEQNKSRMKKVSLEEHDDDNEERREETEQDQDWEGTSKQEVRKCKAKKRKFKPGGDSEDEDDEDYAWLKVPLDILKITAPTAVRERKP